MHSVCVSVLFIAAVPTDTENFNTLVPLIYKRQDLHGVYKSMLVRYRATNNLGYKDGVLENLPTLMDELKTFFKILCPKMNSMHCVVTVNNYTI